MSVLQLFTVHLRWLLSHFLKSYVYGCKPASSDGLHVLHLSPNFLVVDKQYDIPVNTDCPNQHPVTVATQLNTCFPELADPDVAYGFRFCHRLDYSTSGVLCIALNKNAARANSTVMESRRAEKFYLALVHGHMIHERQTVNQDIGIDSRPDYSHRMCTSDKEYCIRPRWACSRILVLQRGFYCRSPATKILLKLVTGRRHQLRVHCHVLGHTIVGDYTYSDRTDIAPPRMFLHSFRLLLPTEMEKIDIQTEDPFTENRYYNEWQPIELVNELNKEVFSKI